MKKGGILVHFCIFLLVLGLFSRHFCLPAAQAGEDSIVFNELAWMGTEKSANDEWIELRNLSATDIVIDAWKILAGDGTPEIILEGVIASGDLFLLERTDDDSVASTIADQIYTGALGNSGEDLSLIDKDGNLIDKLEYGEAWPAGDNESKLSMTLGANGEWQSQLPSPGKLNIQVKNEDKEIDGQKAEETEELATSTDEERVIAENGSSKKIIDNKKGALLLSEIVSDPEEGEEEWIELYNTTASDIDLDNWVIEEGSGAKTSLSGTIGSYDYFVIEEIKGNLNNSGDVVVLRDDQGLLIDSVTYGDWDDGQSNGNAPLAKKPNCLIRKDLSTNTGKDSDNFAVSSTKTKNGSNIYEATVVEEKKKTSNGKLIFSELFPNPKGKDLDEEFIELFNPGDKMIDLSNWQIVDQAGAVYLFQKGETIAARSYLLLRRKESKIALNNGGDKLSIYRPGQKSVVATIEYAEAPTNMSYICLDESENELGVLKNFDCLWTKTISPDAKNTIDIPNREPIADFSIDSLLLVRIPVLFDASDSVDPDGDKLGYLWDFGDGFSSKHLLADHIYKKAGNYKVRLTVSDGEYEVYKERTINVMAWEVDVEEIDNEYDLKLDWDKIKIDSFVANPEGSDQENEWLKIVNTGDRELDLIDWQVDDAEGGSSPFTFLESLVLQPGEKYELSREDSKLALNNNYDELRLISPDGQVMDLATYGKSQEGQIFTRNDLGDWQWSESSQELIDGQDKKPLQAKAELKIEKNPQKSEEIFKKGAFVSQEGVVAVKPGVLSSQYFYLLGDKNVQVYSYKKDFPKLEIGDRVKASGEVSIVNDEYRIKTKSKDDIIVLGKDDLSMTKELSCKEVRELKQPELCKIQGEVLKKSSDKLIIGDGSSELEVYINEATQISLAGLSEGDRLSIIGIGANSRSGKRLEPRMQSDIILLDKNGEEGIVLGENEERAEWSLEPRDTKKEKLLYLISIFIFVLVVAIGLYLKYRKTL